MVIISLTMHLATKAELPLVFLTLCLGGKNTPLVSLAGLGNAFCQSIAQKEETHEDNVRLRLSRHSYFFLSMSVHMLLGCHEAASSKWESIAVIPL